MSPLILAGMAHAYASGEDGSTYTTTSSDAPDIRPSSNPFPVEPGGFFVGSMLACLLYGIHISQIYTYFSRVRWRSIPSTSLGIGRGTNSGSLPPSASAPLVHRLVVLWVFTLSTIHILIVIPSGYWYFVGGLRQPERWGQFYWLLSVQDGVVPLMAATAQLYFGHRAWCLLGKRPWFKWALICMVGVTMGMGVCLAVAAHVYGSDPWIPISTLSSRPIASISEACSITWMALSAFIDGTMTCILVYKFARARQSTLWSTRKVARRLVALTLETVLLTHIVGATMCILFLVNDPRHRTRNNLFWVLLEVTAELYALSVLFTVMSHERVRRGLRGDQHWAWESTITVDQASPAVGAIGQMRGAGGDEGQGEDSGAADGRHAQRRGGRIKGKNSAGRGGGSGRDEKGNGSGGSGGRKNEPKDLSQTELDRRVEGYQTQHQISITTLPYHQPRQRQQVNVVPTLAFDAPAEMRSKGRSDPPSMSTSSSPKSITYTRNTRETSPADSDDVEKGDWRDLGSSAFGSGRQLGGNGHGTDRSDSGSALGLALGSSVAGSAQGLDDKHQQGGGALGLAFDLAAARSLASGFDQLAPRYPPRTPRAYPSLQLETDDERDVYNHHEQHIHAQIPLQTRTPHPASPPRRGQHLDLTLDDAYDTDSPLYPPPTPATLQHNPRNLPGPTASHTPLFATSALPPHPIPLLAVQGRPVSFGQAIEQGIMSDVETNSGTEAESIPVGSGGLGLCTPRVGGVGLMALPLPQTTAPNTPAVRNLLLVDEEASHTSPGR